MLRKALLLFLLVFILVPTPAEAGKGQVLKAGKSIRGACRAGSNFDNGQYKYVIYNEVGGPVRVNIGSGFPDCQSIQIVQKNQRKSSNLHVWMWPVQVEDASYYHSSVVLSLTNGDLAVYSLTSQQALAVQSWQGNPLEVESYAEVEWPSTIYVQVEMWRTRDSWGTYMTSRFNLDL